MRGHIRKRGTSWEIRAYAGADPLTGRQTTVTRTIHGGKRDAENALAALLVEIGQGEHAAQDATLGDLVVRWFETAKGDLSPTTRSGYHSKIETHILPQLGALPLAKLKTAQLDAYYAKLRNSGAANGAPLAPATVRQVHAIIRRALNQGIKWGWIPSNPAALATPPKVVREQFDLPSPDDLLRLLTMVEATDPDMACFLLLSITTGARRSELCGLRWKAVDLDAQSMTIGRAVVEDERGALVEKGTKTHSIRRIALDAGSTEALIARRAKGEEIASQFGLALTPDGYVFSNSPGSERPWEPTAVTKRFNKLRKQAGLSYFRLHDLRHFAATRLLAAGVPVRTVSGRLGHANAAPTLGVYAHFVEASDREAAEVMGKMFRERRK